MPQDWKEHIGTFTTSTSTDKTDISGFYFFQDAGSYTPPEDLADFLKSGKPPVYIGWVFAFRAMIKLNDRFGSVPVENPEIVTGMSISHGPSELMFRNDLWSHASYWKQSNRFSRMGRIR
jgi:hypothetical protein